MQIKKMYCESSFIHCLPIFVVFTNCIDPMVVEFVVLNSTGNNQLENCILLDSSFGGLSGPRDPRQLEPHNQ